MRLCLGREQSSEHQNVTHAPRRTLPCHMLTAVFYHRRRDSFKGNREKLDSKNEQLICEAEAMCLRTGTALTNPVL